MTRTAPARTALTLLVGTLLSLCGTTTLDAAVEIRLTSGDLMTGDIAQETDTTVQLKRVIMIRHKAVESTMTLQKSNITSRKEVPALTEQYKTRAAETPENVLSQCVLARWCYERALVEQSLQHTKIAEKLDNNNPIVAKLYNDLGFVKDEANGWISQDEYLAKTGKVSLGGTIMTKEEAELAKNKIIQNSSASRLEQQIRDAEYTIKNAETKVAEYTAQRDEAKGDVAKSKSDAAGAKNRIESLSKRAEERSKQQQNNRSQQNEKNDQAALSEANATYSKATAEQKKSERELAAAEERLEKYKVTLDKAKKDLPGLKKQLEELTGKPTSEEAATAAGKKPATSDKPSDKDAPTTEKPKGRFGDL